MMEKYQNLFVKYVTRWTLFYFAQRVLLYLIPIAISACGSGEKAMTDNPNKSPTDTSQITHQLLSAPDKRETILGSDIDQNGIRDDLDSYIIKKFSEDPVSEKLVRRYFMTSQNLLKKKYQLDDVERSNSQTKSQDLQNAKIELKRALQERIHAYFCILKISESNRALEKENSHLSSRFENTWQRQSLFNEALASAGMISISLESKDQAPCL